MTFGPYPLARRFLGRRHALQWATKAEGVFVSNGGDLAFKHFTPPLMARVESWRFSVDWGTFRKLARGSDRTRPS